MGMGDEIMVTGEVKRIAGPAPTRFAIWDRRTDSQRWHEIWEGNPRIARPGSYFERKLFNHGGDRPYILSKSAKRWQWKEYTPEPGEIFLNVHEQRYACEGRGKIVIHVELKNGASPNKAWGFEYWKALVAQAPHLPWLQVASSSMIPRVPGARFLVTPSFRFACAVLSEAKAAVLTEGGLHHAAAAFQKPAVVIYGGFISPRSTGYSFHSNLFRETREHPMGCGSRLPCQHCAQAMKSFQPSVVRHELEKLL